MWVRVEDLAGLGAVGSGRRVVSFLQQKEQQLRAQAQAFGKGVQYVPPRSMTSQSSYEATERARALREQRAAEAKAKADQARAAREQKNREYQERARREAEARQRNYLENVRKQAEAEYNRHVAQQPAPPQTGQILPTYPTGYTPLSPNQNVQQYRHGAVNPAAASLLSQAGTRLVRTM